MKIRSNSLMDMYLWQLDYDLLSKIDLPNELEEIIESGLVIKNDVYVLKVLCNIIPSNLINDEEKCIYEESENHFHPDSYVDSNNEIDYLKYAIESAKRLVNRFKREFPHELFRIIVSFNETIIRNEEIETYGSSTVRFYKVRVGCDNVMYIKDLNDIDTAVVEIETL